MWEPEVWEQEHFQLLDTASWQAQLNLLDCQVSAGWLGCVIEAYGSGLERWM